MRLIIAIGPQMTKYRPAMLLILDARSPAISVLLDTGTAWTFMFIYGTSERILEYAYKPD